jgi:hypothetical protein
MISDEETDKENDRRNDFTGTEAYSQSTPTQDCCTRNLHPFSKPPQTPLKPQSSLLSARFSLQKVHGYSKRLLRRGGEQQIVGNVSLFLSAAP